MYIGSIIEHTYTYIYIRGWMNMCICSQSCWRKMDRGIDITRVTAWEYTAKIVDVGKVAPTQIDHMWSKTLPKIHQTRANMGPKSVQNRSLRGSGGVLGGSWGSWGLSWPQDGPKSQHKSKKQTLVSPIGGQVGSQNRAKIGPKSIQDVIIFLIGSWTDFKSIWLPTWLQLGSQNPPKMEPSWFQNRPNLEHSFRS